MSIRRHFLPKRVEIQSVQRKTSKKQQAASTWGRNLLVTIHQLRSHSGYVLSCALLLGIFAIWQGAVVFKNLPSYILPSPIQVLQAYSDPEIRGLILDNIGSTLEEALLGFGMCVILGILCAVLMYRSRIIRDAVYPLLIASQAMPIIAIGALLVIAFGYDLTPKIVVVVLYSFFPVTVNLYDSLIKIDPQLPELLQTLGASSWQIMRTARIPAALPGLFTGAKLAITYSLSGAIYGEWVGSTEGLGYALQMAKNQFATAAVWAIVGVMIALGVVAFSVVSILERMLVPWTRT